MDFALLADHGVKLKESEKRNKYLDLARELKKLWNMKVTVIPFIIGALGTVTNGIKKGLVDLERKRLSGDHPNDSIIEIGQNTKKSPGDLRRLAISQTAMINHQLALVWKTLKRFIINGQNIEKGPGDLRRLAVT